MFIQIAILVIIMKHGVIVMFNPTVKSVHNCKTNNCIERDQLPITYFRDAHDGFDDGRF